MTLNRFYNFKQNLNKMFSNESVRQYFQPNVSIFNKFLARFLILSFNNIFINAVKLYGKVI